MAAFFVTATGTDIGKTFVTQSLIRQLRREGRSVEALKPVVSGFDPASAAVSDPGVLLAALGRAVNDKELDRISPWRFAAALSPDLAARRQDRALDFGAVVTFSRRAIADNKGILLIEGVGGIMTPIGERQTVLDWMIELRLPVILVAGSYLGTLSHTLSALDVLTRRNLAVRALVISETAASTVPLNDTVETLARFATGVPLMAVPRTTPSSAPHPVFAKLVGLVGAGIL